MFDDVNKLFGGEQSAIRAAKDYCEGVDGLVDGQLLYPLGSYFRSKCATYVPILPSPRM